MPEPGRYKFTTEWTIPAPPERVWAELMDPERWPQWWPGVVRSRRSARASLAELVPSVATLFEAACRIG